MTWSPLAAAIALPQVVPPVVLGVLMYALPRSRRRGIVVAGAIAPYTLGYGVALVRQLAEAGGEEVLWGLNPAWSLTLLPYVAAGVLALVVSGVRVPAAMGPGLPLASRARHWPG